MAGALRPVVILMLVASVLFVAAGAIDGVYPGGAGWSVGDLAALSYVFALINTFVAILVARGSEKSLALRMGLSLFFVVERPISAFFLGPKSSPSIGIHIATALVELVILASALRVWRLGHSVATAELEQLFAIDTATPVTASPMEAPEHARANRARPARSAWLIGILSLLLAAVFVADGLASGFVPGGRAWGLTGSDSGWLVYLFGTVTLVIATRAVRGGRFALRLLTATALIFFLERAFSPFALRVLDPIALGLHGVAAFLALALALGAASAIRSQRSASSADVPSLEAA